MLTIDENQLRRGLALANPWWQDSGWEPNEKEHYRAYFEPFRDRALKVKRSTVLMGPRRVGKTVMLLQLIGHVLRQGDIYPANRIFFAALDIPLYSGMNLEKLLELFEAETGCAPDEQRLVIFDEIQYLPDWEKHLKELTDQFPNTRFVVSTSAAAVRSRQSTESEAGRLTDFMLPPLTFYEFLQFRGAIEATDDDEIIEEVKDIELLNGYFLEYLNYGSFPELAMNPEIQKDPKHFVGRDIIDRVLLKDLPSLHGIRDQQELNRLFTTLAYNTGGEISLQSLSRNSGVSKARIERYMDYLEAAMLIKRIRRIDDTAMGFLKFLRKRTFKVYLTSPAMWAALFGHVDDGSAIMGRLVKTAIFAQRFHSAFADHIYYARWGRGREVDMVHVLANFKPTDAMEIKWSDRHISDSGEVAGLVEYCQKNLQSEDKVIATTKTVSAELEIQGRKIRFIPTAFTCFFLGKNVVSDPDPDLNINAP